MNIRDRIRELRRVPASDLRPNPRNWRTHPQHQRDALKGVLAEVGFADACIARELDDGTLELIDGHLRAEEVGDAKVPVLVLDVTDAEARKLLAVIDPLANAAGQDDEKLSALLAEIDTESEALRELLDGLDIDTAGVSEVTEDDPPEPPDDPITKPGDLWLLGEHRLLCGDSTKAEDVARVLDGRKPSAFISDPPYGVDYKGKTKEKLPVHNDGADQLGGLLDAAFAAAMEHCLEGGAWYVTAPPGPSHIEFANRLIRIGVYRQTLVWVKDRFVLGHSDYHYQHEPIFYGWKPGARHREPPDRKQTSLWHFDRPGASREHPTMKPVALFAKMLENSTTVGSEILDLFLGSGTTLIAAEQLGRRCYGIEISPAYCDVIVKRWENLTGEKAELESSESTAMLS